MQKKLTLTNKWEHGLGLMAATYVIGLIVFGPLWLWAQFFSFIYPLLNTFAPIRSILDVVYIVVPFIYLIAGAPLIFYWMAGKIGYPYAIRKWSHDGRETVNENQNNEVPG